MRRFMWFSVLLSALTVATSVSAQDIRRALFIVTLLAALLAAEATTPAWSGGGKSYGGGGGSIASPSPMSPEMRAKLEAELKAKSPEELDRIIKNWDKALQAARIIDLGIGFGFSLVPYGGFVYGSAKTVGYVAMGEYKDAAWSAFGAGLSGVGTIAGQATDAAIAAGKEVPGLVAVELTAKLGTFIKNAYTAIDIGLDAGQAFSK